MKSRKLIAPSLSAILLMATLVRAVAEDPTEAAQTMIANEAKFVAMGLEQGTRAASLAFFADDAILFEPGPVNAKKIWSARTDEASPSLKWEPTLAGMARSCDLGFTTGPAEWRKKKEDEKPFGYGQYISIWKKQKDGAWKVAVDVGGGVPSGKKVEDPPEISVSQFAIVASPEAVKAAERNFREADKWFATTAKTDSTAALVGASSETIRVHREGVFPANGREAANLMLSVRRGKLTSERLGGDMSQARDLAYSYGKYSLERSQNTERGHYLQIWQTDAAGAWKLVLDFQSPLRAAIQKVGE